MPAAIILAGVAIALLPAASASDNLWLLPRTQALAYTAIPLLATFLCATLLAKAFYIHGINAWMPIVGWLALISFGPIGYDMVEQALATTGRDFAMAERSDFSPIGMLHAVWRRGAAPAPPAVVAHAAYVAVTTAALAASIALRKRLRREGEMPKTP